MARDRRGRTPLHLAAACGQVGVLTLLLEVAPAAADMPDTAGYTPVHWAAYNGHEGALEGLMQVQPGVKKEAEGQAVSSFSPIHCAVYNGSEQVEIKTAGHICKTNCKSKE